VGYVDVGLEHREEMRLRTSCWAALCETQHLGEGLPCLTRSEELVNAILTKTPLRFVQFDGRCSLFLRQLRHVLFTVFSFVAFLPNLPVLVTAQSIVSLLLIACVHLLVILFS